MSHIKHISFPPINPGSNASQIDQPEITRASLPLRSCDPHWEKHWRIAYERLKMAETARDAALDIQTEPSLMAQLCAIVAQREKEVHRAFLSQFQTADEYAAWRLSILDLELRWHSGRPHRIAPGLPIVEINRRLDAVRIYALGPPLCNPKEPPSDWRRMVRNILEAPPESEVIRLASELHDLDGDSATVNIIG